jgi:hypothetical protein
LDKTVEFDELSAFLSETDSDVEFVSYHIHDACGCGLTGDCSCDSLYGDDNRIDGWITYDPFGFVPMVEI